MRVRLEKLRRIGFTNSSDGTAPQQSRRFAIASCDQMLALLVKPGTVYRILA